MGRQKELWMQLQDEQPMREWIDDNFGVLDEGSGEWFDAVNEYRLQQEIQSIQDMMDLQQYDYDYFNGRSVSDAFETFLYDIDELSKMLEKANEDLLTPTFLKMVYAHSVTVMEVFLEDVVKGLVASDNQYLKNTIRNVQPFDKGRFNLNEISVEEDGIKKFVLSKLSENLFHNIPKVVNILCGVLEKKIDINVDAIIEITSVRHDVVHRNGKNKDGELIDVNYESVNEVVTTVREFGTAILLFITEPDGDAECPA